MEITNTINKLIELLLDVDENDDDFVKFVVSAAGTDENRETLINYIETKKINGSPIDKSQVTKISIKMAQNLREGKESLLEEKRASQRFSDEQNRFLAELGLSEDSDVAIIEDVVSKKLMKEGFDRGHIRVNDIGIMCESILDAIADD